MFFMLGTPWTFLLVYDTKTINISKDKRDHSLKTLIFSSFLKAGHNFTRFPYVRPLYCHCRQWKFKLNPFLISLCFLIQMRCKLEWASKGDLNWNEEGPSPVTNFKVDSPSLRLLWMIPIQCLMLYNYFPPASINI